MADAGGGYIALASSDSSTTTSACTPEGATFKAVDAGEKLVQLRTKEGTYCGVIHGKVACLATAAGKDETFTVECLQGCHDGGNDGKVQDGVQPQNDAASLSATGTRCNGAVSCVDQGELLLNICAPELTGASWQDPTCAITNASLRAVMD